MWPTAYWKTFVKSLKPKTILQFYMVQCFLYSVGFDLQKLKFKKAINSKWLLKVVKNYGF